MNSSLAYGSYGSATQDRTRTLFGQTMGYVAVTAGFFALGSYLGRNLSQGWTFVWFIVAIACLSTMNFTARRSRSGSLSTVLIFVVGTALGLAMAPLLVYYATTSPRTLWEAGGATALFIAGFGAAGAARRGRCRARPPGRPTIRACGRRSVLAKPVRWIRSARFAMLLCGAVLVLTFPDANLEFLAWFGLVPGLVLIVRSPTAREGGSAPGGSGPGT